MSGSVLDHALSGQALVAADKWLRTLEDPQGVTAFHILDLVGRSDDGQADRSLRIEQTLAMLCAGDERATAAFMLLYATIALERLDATVRSRGGRLEFELGFKEALLSGRPLSGLIRVKWNDAADVIREQLEDEEGGGS